jgi:Ca2+-transporting ATPase
LAILLHQFRSPLIYILLVATAVTLFLGEYIDAGVIAAVLALKAVIGFVQEHRAEHSVRALMQLVSPHARVIRGGREREVESRELVPGDLVLLESGVRVPADLRLISATTLIDRRIAADRRIGSRDKKTTPLEREDLPLGDRMNMAYAGSIVSSGRGRGYVVATGASTELGAIAEHVRTKERADTPLQARMSRFAGIVGVVGCDRSHRRLWLGYSQRGERGADVHGGRGHRYRHG